MGLHEKKFLEALLFCLEENDQLISFESFKCIHRMKKEKPPTLRALQLADFKTILGIVITLIALSMLNLVAEICTYQIRKLVLNHWDKISLMLKKVESRFSRKKTPKAPNLPLIVCFSLNWQHAYLFWHYRSQAVTLKNSTFPFDVLDSFIFLRHCHKKRLLSKTPQTEIKNRQPWQPVILSI